MKKKLITLVLASIVLTGCGSASKNASSPVYMAETAAAYDTASGAANGMPASFSKSASANFNAGAEEAYATEDYEAAAEDFSADSGSAELSPNALLSQNTVNPETDPVKNPDETPQAPIERKLIRNVNMDLETREFDTLTKSISDAVTTFGGYTPASRPVSHPISWMLFLQKYPAKAMSPTKMKAYRMLHFNIPTSPAGRKPCRWSRNAYGHFWKKQNLSMPSSHWNPVFPKSATS